VIGMTSLCLLMLLMHNGMKLKLSDKSDAKRVKRETPFIRGGSKDSLTTAVALTLKDDSKKEVFCSGNILSSSFIATAAHCMDKIKDRAGHLNVENLEVLAGEANLWNYRRGEKGFEEIFSVKRATLHPHFNKEKNGNMVWDLALLELNEEMDLESTQRMEAAVLPPPELRLAGREITVGGLRQTDGVPGRQIFDLQAINITVHPQEICEGKYPDSFITENMFCAGAKGTTAYRGDSGSSALLHTNGKIFLLGVVSYGLDTRVFSSIGKSLPWIFKETGLKPDYEIYSTGSFYDEFIEDTAPPPPPPKKDLIYLGRAPLFELPTFSPLYDCSIPPHPVEELHDAVTGLVEGKIMTCGGRNNYIEQSGCHLLDEGAWRSQPSLKTNWQSAAASLTKNGKMMVTGGWDGNDWLSSTEIFTGGQWEAGTELPVKMSQHCQVTSNEGVIVAGIDWYNAEIFFVYRLEKGKWNKMTERKWRLRTRHSCELLDDRTMVVIGGSNYYKSVDILDLGRLSWSKGPELPVEMYYDLSTVYQDTLIIIETNEGLVYSIPTNLTGGWKKIAELGQLPSRRVFPAPVLKESDFKCE